MNMRLMLSSFKIFFFFLISFYIVKPNDKLYKIYRVFISGGVILEPTVIIENEELLRDVEYSVFGGIKIGIDNINSIFKKNRVGFVNKNKIFFSKLCDNNLYTKTGMKEDFKRFIVGLQCEVGMSVILNKDFSGISFNELNNINRTAIHSLNFFAGIKEEIGDFFNSSLLKKIFPTKLIGDITYIIDLKYGFSFYLSISIFYCFSPVYLFSFNKADFLNVFNCKNNFPWNITIDIGIFGMSFFV